jgi:transcriptional regulator with XRE-family HTH domain
MYTGDMDSLPNGVPNGGMGPELAGLGARLRRLRGERGWRLEDLAERTGLSKAYLSRLEGGERQPSLSSLFGVARAYDVPFSSLFEAEAEEVVVVRADGEAQRGNGLLYSRLSGGGWAFNLQPLRVVVPAEREGGALYRHEGEQWMYVLSGRLRFEIAGEEVVLGEGDAAHFDADRPHRFEALDGRDAEAIVVACAVPYLLLKSYL